MNERILVVHHEKNLIRLIQYNLERQGYQVESATSCGQALTMAHQNPPDLLVAYEKMPAISGSELIACLRRNPGLAALPALLIKGGRHGGESQMQGIKDIEIEQEMRQGELSQPFHPAELCALARRLLDLK